MARPPRKNVDYFPHYISDGKKMFILENKYGNDGYATWFKVLESLAKTDDHWLNLNQDSEVMYLSSVCKVSEETLLKILDDLAKLNEINYDLWISKIVWSDKFIDSIQDAYAKRSNNCMSLEGLRSHLLGLGILKGVENPQSKVKETKVDKSKEEETKVIFDNFWNRYDKKIDKQGAFKAFKKLTSDEIKEVHDLIDGYVQATPDKKFRPNFATFLNAKRWRDDFEDLKNRINGNSRNEFNSRMANW